MCGIAGMLGRVDPSRLGRAIEALRHRGPDSEGTWIASSGAVGLAHTRLSVIDLPGGNQPLFSEDQSIAVVFNGEIYNYLELRDELLAAGHQLRTRSDTEVLVHLYEERGLELVHALRGMFAFAVWDARRQRLLVARDRLGVKPLYYGTDEHGAFCFASEIPALCKLMPSAGRLDDQALSDYLSWGHVPAPRTIYEGIRALDPAHRLIVDHGGAPMADRYWRLPRPGAGGPSSRQEAEHEIEARFREAVRLRLRSDVPVGVFLSGGIDSGLVAALAAEHHPGRLTTLSVGFEDDAFDERPLARQVAERYETDHHELLIKPELEDVLPRLAAAYGQPYADASAVPSYCLAKVARHHRKVVLNGDGGDEALAGYRRYVATWLSRRLGPLGDARGFWRILDALLPRTTSFRTRSAFVRRLVRGLALPEAQRLMAWGNDAFTETEKQQLVGDRGDWLGLCGPSWSPIATRLADEGAPRDALARHLWIDAQTLLPDDLLVKMDIATMAHGLEARSPLLDHLVFETAAGLPSHLRLNGTTTKPILRRLAGRYLPEAVVGAPKRGFEVPLIRWLQEDLRPLRDDLLLQPTGLLRQRFDPAGIRALVHNQDGLDPGRWSRRVWTLMMLALWDAHGR